MQIIQNVINSGVFLGWNMLEHHSVSSLSEGRKPEQQSGILFPGIGITNTTPLPPNYGSHFAFRNLFQKKSSAA
jgi:hypothetical protein